jgi:hypothetical protein
MFIANAVRSLIEVASNEAESAAGVDEIARLFEKMAPSGSRAHDSPGGY